IVYYGRYLPYFDLARVEYLRHLGLLRYQVGAGEHEFVMRASTVEYFAPARFDDMLEIFVRLRRIGRTSASFECAAYGVEEDQLMVTALQTLVLVDLEERRRVHVPVSYRGERVGELAVDGAASAPFLERVATLISAHVLIGWDTGGERWDP